MVTVAAKPNIKQNQIASCNNTLHLAEEGT
jgi:hypothetical protein